MRLATAPTSPYGTLCYRQSHWRSLLVTWWFTPSYARLTAASGSRSIRTTELHQTTAETLGKTTETYTLGQLHYDLAKLRGKGLVERIDGSQAYRILPEGYRIAVLYLKLFHRIYGP